MKLSIQAKSVCALESTRFTPDIALLEQSEFQRVFIYGEMQRGHRSCVLLPEDLAQKDSICYTDSYFILWKKHLGKASHAIATDVSELWKKPDWATPIRARIQGELYATYSSHIPILDIYYQNGVEFERRRVKILRPWRHIVRAKDGFPLNGQHLESFKARGIVHSMRGCTVLDAWMYTAIPEYWSGQLSRQFVPVQKYTSPNEPWLKDYYSFTLLEYET